MIPELIAKAKELDLAADELLEVHCTAGPVCECGEFIYDDFQGGVVQGRTTLREFIRKWRVLGDDAVNVFVCRECRLPQSRWVGIVHDDGVLLVPLDAGVAR